MDNNDIMLRIKLQEIQSEKQGDKRQANLVNKQEVTQDDIDEYNDQFDDTLQDIQEPGEEKEQREQEMNEQDWEYLNDEIQQLSRAREDISSKIQQVKDNTNKRIEKARQDSKLDDRRKEAVINSHKFYEKTDIENLIKDDKKIEAELERLMKKYQDETAVKQENQEKIVRDKAANRKNLQKYVEDLNMVNDRKLLNLEQGPNESYDDYIQRVKDSISNYNSSNTKKDLESINNSKKLKVKLASIIKKKSVIENVIKSLDEDEMKELLKKWSKFNSAYQKEYSFDSKVSEADVKNIIAIYEDPVEVSIKNKSKQSGISLGKNKDNFTGLINTPNGIFYVKVGSNQSVLVSKTGDQGSFKSLNFQEKRAPNYVDTVLGSNIKKNDLMALIKTVTTSGHPDVVDDGKSSGFNKTFGMGLSKPIVDNFILGKVMIKLDKLYSKNTLVVLRNSNIYSKIPGFSNATVSDDFVKLILAIYNDENINSYFSKLKQVEKDLYIQLLYIAGLQNSSIRGNGINSDDVVEKIKERLNLVEAEIEAGNNGREIRLELKNLLDQLVNLRAIPFAKAKKHYNQILFQFFEQD